MGYFTHFEHGNRTDAVIKDNKGMDVAHIEWEWQQPFKEGVNEIKKLYEARDGAEFSVFISYSRTQDHEKNIAKINRDWKKSDIPLIAILVTFDFYDRVRHFQKLEAYEFQRGNIRKFRVQPALPWTLKGTRWEEAS